MILPDDSESNTRLFQTKCKTRLFLRSADSYLEPPNLKPTSKRLIAEQGHRMSMHPMPAIFEKDSASGPEAPAPPLLDRLLPRISLRQAV